MSRLGRHRNLSSRHSLSPMLALTTPAGHKAATSHGPSASTDERPQKSSSPACRRRVFVVPRRAYVRPREERNLESAIGPTVAITRGLRSLLPRVHSIRGAARAGEGDLGDSVNRVGCARRLVCRSSVWRSSPLSAPTPVQGMPRPRDGRSSGPSSRACGRTVSPRQRHFRGRSTVMSAASVKSNA
jgi:hypothetical protein